MHTYNILLNFLLKYLFIMNAASDGWRICYIGGNRFEFYNNIYFKQQGNAHVPLATPKQFIDKYTKYKYINE